jgi:hypothetical protein
MLAKLSNDAWEKVHIGKLTRRKKVLQRRECPGEAGESIVGHRSGLIVKTHEEGKVAGL